MTALADIAARVGRGLSALTTAATYRVTAPYTLRVASAAAAGATSIGFTNVPAALAATAVGDTFLIGATTHTVANIVTASGGALAGVAFTPALAVSVPAGAQVVLNRATDHAVSVIVEQVDGYGLAPGIYAGGDFRATIFGLPTGVVPSGSGSNKLIWSGKELTVKEEIGRDPAGAAWVVRCR